MELKSTDCIARFLQQEAPSLPFEAKVSTPDRFTSAFRELMGYNDPQWQFTTFESDCDEMILIKDISFVSLCEHHMLPFMGVAHVGYLPQGRLAGLSKIARCVRHWCRGMWTQEHLTMAIADDLEKELVPLAVGVILEAEHTCMTIRGVRAPGSKTTTSAMRGVFRDNTNIARSEFLGLLR